MRRCLLRRARSGAAGLLVAVGVLGPGLLAGPASARTHRHHHKHHSAAALTRKEIIALIRKYAYTKPGTPGAPGAPGAPGTPTPVTPGLGLIRSGTTLSVDPRSFACPPYEFYFGLQKDGSAGCDFPALAYAGELSGNSGTFPLGTPIASTIGVGTSGDYFVTGYVTVYNPQGGPPAEVQCFLQNGSRSLAGTQQSLAPGTDADVSLSGIDTVAAAGNVYSILCYGGSSQAVYFHPFASSPAANVTAIPISPKSSVQ